MSNQHKKYLTLTDWDKTWFLHCVCWGSDASRHMTRGAASVNLLGGLINPPPVPSDSETFFVGVDSVSSLHHLVQSVLN